MNGYMNYIDNTKDADSKKILKATKYFPNTSDFLRHKRRMPDRTNISMEDMRIHYRSNQMVIQMCPIHPSFLVGSYDQASRSTGLGEHASELLNGGEDRDPVILRAALVEDNGIPDSRIVGSDPGINYAIENQAHHIVETHNAIGQEILRNADIYSNSAANGVLLPVAEGDGRGNAAIHNGRHIREYTNCVNKALRKATSGRTPHTDRYGERVINVLSKIRRILLNNNMALNGRGDPDYVYGSPNNKKSISDIFREQRLIRR